MEMNENSKSQKRKREPSYVAEWDAAYYYGLAVGKDYKGKFKDYNEAECAAHRFLNERYIFEFGPTPNHIYVELFEGFSEGFIEAAEMEYDPNWVFVDTEENMEKSGYYIKD
jgi:hypothetical protein